MLLGCYIYQLKKSELMEKVCACARVCVKEWGREKWCVCVYVCVCVCERERERERERESRARARVCVCR